mmetsp:Transcript_44071/g.103789  ORF Transcript_44071/g.103789 Transcript_44071/m.103789 type:complete len:204 (+) Transcript_44071:852-1463(+)
MGLRAKRRPEHVGCGVRAVQSRHRAVPDRHREGWQEHAARGHSRHRCTALGLQQWRWLRYNGGLCRAEVAARLRGARRYGAAGSLPDSSPQQSLPGGRCAPSGCEPAPLRCEPAHARSDGSVHGSRARGRGLWYCAPPGGGSVVHAARGFTTHALRTHVRRPEIRPRDAACARCRARRGGVPVPDSVGALLDSLRRPLSLFPR